MKMKDETSKFVSFKGEKIFMEKFNLDTPIFLFLTLIEVKDYVISENKKFWFDNVFPIDREIVLIPELIIEEYDFDPPQLLKPIFDSIWNACGFERSLNYNKKGEWNPYS